MIGDGLLPIEVARDLLSGELEPVAYAIGVLWLIFILESIGVVRMPAVSPRGDLTGVATANLGHESLGHLASNSLGVALLMSLYLLYVENPWIGLTVMFFGSTGLYWLVGSANTNNGRGASYVLFALNGWFVVWAWRAAQQQLDVIGIALTAVTVVTMVYLAPMMLPGREGMATSAHLSGFVVGVAWTIWGQPLVG